MYNQENGGLKQSFFLSWFRFIQFAELQQKRKREIDSQKIRNLQRNFCIIQHMLSSLLWLLHRWGETESPAGQIKNEQIQTQQGFNCFTNVNRKRVKQAGEEDFLFFFFVLLFLFFF